MWSNFVDGMKKSFDEEYGFWLFAILSFSVYTIVWYALEPGAMRLVFTVFCTAVFLYAGSLRSTFASYRALNKDKSKWS